MSMLTRWDPFAEIARLQNDFDRTWGQTHRSFAPAVDIFEEDQAIVLTAEVPGMKAEDIEVQVENQVLSLSGARRLANDESRDGYHRIERAYGSFTRSFVLPKSVDGEQIDAHLESGVLTLRLPKRPQSEPRRISVRNAEATA